MAIPRIEVPYLAARPPARPQFRKGRRQALRSQIVVHDTEQDPWASPVPSLSVAQYIRDRDTPGSYHSVIDQHASMLIVSYFDEAFHVATHRANQYTLGMSFCCRTDDFRFGLPGGPGGWYLNGAERARDMSDWCVDQGVGPVEGRLLTVEEFLGGESGFISHGALDPARRTDPGPHFNWGLFLNIYNGVMTETSGDLPRCPYELQDLLKGHGFYDGPIDGFYTADVRAGLHRLKNEWKARGEQIAEHEASDLGACVARVSRYAHAMHEISSAADDIITDIERITDTIAELGMIDEGDEDD